MFESKSSYKLVVLLVVFLGVVLRLIEYLSCKILSIDEALIVHNIIDNTFLSCLHLMPYSQLAPLGFFVIEKLIGLTFGFSEYALRFFPFLCGLLSLFLFYRLVKQCLDKRVTICVMYLFSVLPYLISYSSTLKQYSSDVMLSICSLLLIVNISQRNLNTKDIFFFCLLGMILIWTSFTSVFMLISGITYLIIFNVLKNNFRNLAGTVCVFTFWMINFLVYFVLFLSAHLQNIGLINFWEGYFLSFTDIKKSITVLVSFLKGACIYSRGIGPIFMLVGLISMLINKKRYFFILFLPLLFTFTASCMHIYPFGDRLTFFIIPVFLIFIGEGIGVVLGSKNKIIILLAILMILKLVHPPSVIAFSGVGFGSKKDIKYALSYLKENIREGDIIYVPNFSQYIFKYYAKRYSLNDDFELQDWNPKYLETHFYRSKRLYLGSKGEILFISLIPEYSGISLNPKYIKHELNMLKGKKRIWVLIMSSNNVTDEILQYFRKYTKEIDSFCTTGSQSSKFFQGVILFSYI